MFLSNLLNKFTKKRVAAVLVTTVTTVLLSLFLYRRGGRKLLN